MQFLKYIFVSSLLISYATFAMEIDYDRYDQMQEIMEVEQSKIKVTTQENPVVKQAPIDIEKKLRNTLEEITITCDRDLKKLRSLLTGSHDETRSEQEISQAISLIHSQDTIEKRFSLCCNNWFIFLPYSGQEQKKLIRIALNDVADRENIDQLLKTWKSQSLALVQKHPLFALMKEQIQLKGFTRDITYYIQNGLPQQSDRKSYADVLFEIVIQETATLSRLSSAINTSDKEIKTELITLFQSIENPATAFLAAHLWIKKHVPHNVKEAHEFVRDTFTGTTCDAKMFSEIYMPMMRFCGDMLVLRLQDSMIYNYCLTHCFKFLVDNVPSPILMTFLVGTFTTNLQSLHQAYVHLVKGLGQEDIVRKKDNFLKAYGMVYVCVSQITQANILFPSIALDKNRFDENIETFTVEYIQNMLNNFKNDIVASPLKPHSDISLVLIKIILNEMSAWSYKVQ